MKQLIQNRHFALNLTLSLGLGMINPIFASNDIEEKLDQLKQTRAQIAHPSFQQIQKFHDHLNTSIKCLKNHDPQGKLVTTQVMFKSMLQQLYHLKSEDSVKAITTLIQQIQPVRAPFFTSVTQNFKHMQIHDFKSDASIHQLKLNEISQFIDDHKATMTLENYQLAFDGYIVLKTMQRDLATLSHHIFTHKEVERNLQITSVVANLEMKMCTDQINQGALKFDFKLTDAERNQFQIHAQDATQVIQWLLTNSIEIQTYRTIFHADLIMRKTTNEADTLLDGGIDRQILHYQTNVQMHKNAQQVAANVSSSIRQLSELSTQITSVINTNVAVKDETKEKDVSELADKLNDVKINK